MTYHNKGDVNDFAKTVLLAGDPLRAKKVADNFLKDAKLITDIRNILGYTGFYKDKKISVMGSGMGGPSIGIYSYELFKYYNADNIIRIGTSGGFQKEIQEGDLVIALSASTDSNYAHQYDLKGQFNPCVSESILLKAMKVIREKGIHLGSIFSSDLFSEYNALGEDSWKKWAKMGILAQEMETFALYCNAAYLNKNALSILSIVTNMASNKDVEDYDLAIDDLIKAGLEIAYEL